MEDYKKPELLDSAGMDKWRIKLGLFRCGYCKKEWVTRIRSVEEGSTKSCGCLQREAVRKTGLKNKQHGLTNSVEYAVWNMMLQRCNNSNNSEYHNYGGRGIRVCEEWKDFENFITDMGRRPKGKLYLERKNNDGHYCKDNCVWATAKEEANNKRNNVLLTFNGKTQTQQQWAEELNIPRETLAKRLKMGWSDEKILTTPIQDNTRLIEFNGKTQTLTEWAKEIGISVQGLIKRLDVLGWSIEDALNKPTRKFKKY